MNTYMKFKKNAKALSPVVASIILIAVTVAVSVVVAAWMGGMTIGLMGSAEQAAITNLEFDVLSNSIVATVQNTGSSQVIINNAFVNGITCTLTTSVTIEKGDFETVTIPIDPADVTVTAGETYDVKLSTAEGNTLVYSAVCPSSP